MPQRGQTLIKWQFNQMKKSEGIRDVTADFSLDTVAEIHRFQSTHPDYAKTPLISLSHLAQYLGCQRVFVKDEAHRFGLNAFKVLGGIYAVARYLAERLNGHIGALSFEALKSPEMKKLTGEITFISATDGNHGRGVAWAARELGHRAVIYLPKGSSIARLKAIRDEGAAAEMTDFNYDETVRYAAKKAEENGWVVIQDTSWEGYDTIPLWIMQGYATLAKETVEQMMDHTPEPPTHLFLQAGVGSFAAAVAAYFVQYYGTSHPKIVLVEPHLANCFYKSFAANDHSIKTVGGKMDTMMAGLACGVPNPKAWDILKLSTETSFSCDDRVAALGMRILGHPLKSDQRIVSGESGAVSTGLLYCLAKDRRFKQVKEKLGLNRSSSVILINTEGDTDEAHYRKVVWEGACPMR